MSVYTDVLNAIVGMTDGLGLYSSVIVGPMPTDNGISIAWANGTLNTFMNKNAAVEMSAVLNAKNTSQQEALDALGTIHTSLNMTKTYPSAENFQITNIETSSAPAYLGREENSQYLYGSSLRVKFFLRGE